MRQRELDACKAKLASTQAKEHVAACAVNEVKQLLVLAEKIMDSRILGTGDMIKRRSAVETAEAEVLAAKTATQAVQTEVAVAEASLASSRVSLAECTITAPLDAIVLQCNVRVGEFAATGTPNWLTLGDTTKLNVRVDIDEHEAHRVKPAAAATAQIKGSSVLSCPAKFLRFVPVVLPKRSLSGDVTERVDTRALQVIYQLETAKLPTAVHVGQQMEVFIAEE